MVVYSPLPGWIAGSGQAKTALSLVCLLLVIAALVPTTYLLFKFN
jgi:hypothetical protein